MRIRTLPAVLLLLPVCLAVPTLRAQTPPPPASAPAAHPAEAQAGQSGETHEGQPGESQAHEGQAHEGQAGEGHEGQAGEGHEAHHGPVVKLFGRILGPGQQSLLKLFNFLLFAGALFFGLRGMLASAFKARAKDLEERLGQAGREKAEGEAQIRELEERMAGLQQELEGIMAKAATDADAERERILEAARAEAEQILLQTRAEIAAQQRVAEADLRALVAGLAVEGAARRLAAEVQGPVAQQAMDHAIEQVGGAQ